jgi:HEAT repeat protein
MRHYLFALALFAAPLVASPPRVINGNVQIISSIAQAESLAGPVWVGYEVPTAHPLYVSCCDGWSHCDQCRLDGDHGFSVTHRERNEPGPAGGDRIVLFVRIRDQQVERLRYLSLDCTLDAAGQTVQWIESVAPADSLAFLTRIVDRGTPRARKDALLALSLHAGGIDPLINIARHNPSSDIRSKALFWLAQQAGEKVTSTLRDAVDNDPEEEVRAHAVFAISQLPDDQGIPLLVELANTHRSTAVRKKAIFWLGQKHDPRALRAIEDILKR